jgi:hypothetical protein
LGSLNEILTPAGVDWLPAGRPNRSIAIWLTMPGVATGLLMLVCFGIKIVTFPKALSSFGVRCKIGVA